MVSSREIQVDLWCLQAIIALLGISGSVEHSSKRVDAYVMLPVVELLRVDVLHRLRIEELLPEPFALQEVEEGEAVRVGDVLGVLGPLPVLQVLQVVDEGGVLEVAALREPCAVSGAQVDGGRTVEILGVREALDELELHEEAGLLRRLCFYRRRHQRRRRGTVHGGAQRLSAQVEQHGRLRPLSERWIRATCSWRTKRLMLICRRNHQSQRRRTSRSILTLPPLPTRTLKVPQIYLLVALFR